MSSESMSNFVQEIGSSGGPVVGTIENFRTTATKALVAALKAIQKALSDIYLYAKEAYDAFDFEELIKSISRMVNRSIIKIRKVTNDVRNSEAVRKASKYIEAKLSDFKSWTESFSEQRKSANPTMVVNPLYAGKTSYPTVDAGTKLNATSERPRNSEGSVRRQKELEEKIRILRAELSAALDDLYRHYNPRIPN